MSGLTAGLFVLGLALLLTGAELLVRGATSLARRFAVPSLVIGLTVVAFGTSAPELAVSVQAALSGSADLALGNVVGSNIFNILFILGASALIIPLAISQRLVRFDVPLMIAASLLIPLFGIGGGIQRWEGVVLVALGLVYTFVLLRQGRREGSGELDVEGVAPGKPGGATLAAVQIALGLGGLVLGSRWLVGGAVELARGLGVSEAVVGLTLVAAGTSLPELATSAVAAWRGQRDLAVGNVVGSNLFNILWILGLAAAVSPQGIPISPAMATLHVPVMIIAALVCLPLLRTGYTLSRWEGGALLAGWVAYTGYLVFDALRATPL